VSSCSGVNTAALPGAGAARGAVSVSAAATCVSAAAESAASAPGSSCDAQRGGSASAATRPERARPGRKQLCNSARRAGAARTCTAAPSSARARSGAPRASSAAAPVVSTSRREGAAEWHVAAAPRLRQAPAGARAAGRAPTHAARLLSAATRGHASDARSADGLVSASIQARTAGGQLEERALRGPPARGEGPSYDTERCVTATAATGDGAAGGPVQCVRAVPERVVRLRIACASPLFGASLLVRGPFACPVHAPGAQSLYPAPRVAAHARVRRRQRALVARGGSGVRRSAFHARALSSHAL